MVETCQERLSDLRAVSFDRGFHSPENRIRLDELLDHNVLPKKGYLNKTERERERSEEFVAMRGQHPAVESAINNLEHRGLDRVLATGAMGFARVVALSVVALNTPPYRPSAAPQGTTTTRRLTAPSRNRRFPGPPDTGTESDAPRVPKVAEFGSECRKPAA